MEILVAASSFVRDGDRRDTDRTAVSVLISGVFVDAIFFLNLADWANCNWWSLFFSLYSSRFGWKVVDAIGSFLLELITPLSTAKSNFDLVVCIGLAGFAVLLL